MWGKRGESEERWQKRKTRAGGESPNKREELREEKKKKKVDCKRLPVPVLAAQNCVMGLQVAKFLGSRWGGEMIVC